MRYLLCSRKMSADALALPHAVETCSSVGGQAAAGGTKIFKKVEDVVLTAVPSTLCCSSRETAAPPLSGLFSLARTSRPAAKNL